MDCIDDLVGGIFWLKGERSALNSILQEDFPGLDLCELLEDLFAFANRQGIEWDGVNLEVQAFGLVIECFCHTGENTDYYIKRTFRFIDGIRRVSHDAFTLPESKQQRGLSRDVLSMFYKQYKKAGIDFIDVEAGKAAGGYAWAKYGFCATSKKEVYQILQQAEGRGISQEAIEVFLAIADAHYGLYENAPFPMDTWATLSEGYALLKRCTWSGVLDLANDDQMHIFEEYLNTKDKKGTYGNSGNKGL